MVNKGDFIELEYTGRFTQNNNIFDTTSEDVAKKNKIHNPKVKYGPAVVCIGQSMLVPGLEKDILDNKEAGKEGNTQAKGKASEAQRNTFARGYNINTG